MWNCVARCMLRCQHASAAARGLLLLPLLPALLAWFPLMEPPLAAPLGEDSATGNPVADTVGSESSSCAPPLLRLTE